jgi:predicted phosphodiesterase
MDTKDLVVTMRDGGASYSEIGNLVDKSADAVRSIYRRAKGTHTIPRPPKEKTNISGDDLVKVAFPTDEHFPFQDNDARYLAMSIVSDFNPDILIVGSDGVDFYTLSKFNRNPARKDTVQDEIDMWGEGQDEWKDAASNARRIFIPGNHEDRLRRYKWTHPEIDSLRALSIERVMELDSKGIESMEEVVFFDKLVIKHGNRVSKHSAYSAKAELENEKHAISVMSGHTHRGGAHYATTRNGIVQAHECFCLCDLNPDYVKSPNWQQGIALATVGPHFLSIELIPFHRVGDLPVAYWRDKMYK